MSDEQRKINVLFLCTGNSCRSQIAEGWARKLKGDCIDAYSAGVKPIGVNEKAAKVMAEAGVDISSQTSNHLDEYADVDFDYVVALCDHAANNCPVFPGKAVVIRHPFVDPYFAEGTEEEIMDAFRKCREEIRGFVERMPENLKELPGK